MLRNKEFGTSNEILRLEKSETFSLAWLNYSCGNNWDSASLTNHFILFVQCILWYYLLNFLRRLWVDKTIVLGDLIGKKSWIWCVLATFATFPKFLKSEMNTYASRNLRRHSSAKDSMFCLSQAIQVGKKIWWLGDFPNSKYLQMKALTQDKSSALPYEGQ